MRGTPIRVRKLAGGEEPFDLGRLTDSLRRALCAAGDPGDHAPDIAAAVAGALALAGGSVCTSRVAATAEAALEETGFGRAALHFRSYREERERRRAALRVHTSEAGRPASSPWSRKRLGSSLVRNRYLETGLAQRVARSVERRLLATGLVHLTGELVAALADTECRSLGVRGDPPRCDRVGPERRALRAWLGAGGLPCAQGLPPALLAEDRDARPHLGGEVLACFAEEELLSRIQRRGLRAGAFDLPGLRDWLRPAAVRLVPRPGESEAGFWERVAARREAAGEVQAAWPAGRKPGRLTREIPRWLKGPGRMRLETGSASLARIWAGAGLPARLPWHAFRRAPHALRQELAGFRLLRLTWMPGGPAAQLSATDGSTVDGLAVINLARAARRAGRGEAAAFFAEVGEQAAAACAALRTLARRARGVRHPALCLLPAGLPAALEVILPREPVAGMAVRSLVLGLREVLEIRGRTAGVRLTRGLPPHHGGAAARLAAAEPGAPPALPVGWNPDSGSLDRLPAAPAFDAAPWLEFPAAACQHPSAALRGSAASPSPASSETREP